MLFTMHSCMQRANERKKQLKPHECQSFSMLANNRADSWPAKPQSFIHLLSLLLFKIPSDQGNIKLHIGNVLVFEIDLETDGNGVATSSHAPPHRLDPCMRSRVASVGMFECSYMWLHYNYIAYKSFSIVDSRLKFNFTFCQTAHWVPDSEPPLWHWHDSWQFIWKLHERRWRVEQLTLVSWKLCFRFLGRPQAMVQWWLWVQCQLPDIPRWMPANPDRVSRGSPWQFVLLPQISILATLSIVEVDLKTTLAYEKLTMSFACRIQGESINQHQFHQPINQSTNEWIKGSSNPPRDKQISANQWIQPPSFHHHGSA